MNGVCKQIVVLRRLEVGNTEFVIHLICKERIAEIPLLEELERECLLDVGVLKASTKVEIKGSKVIANERPFKASILVKCRVMGIPYIVVDEDSIVEGLRNHMLIPLGLGEGIASTNTHVLVYGSNAKIYNLINAKMVWRDGVIELASTKRLSDKFLIVQENELKLLNVLGETERSISLNAKPSFIAYDYDFSIVVYNRDYKMSIFSSDLMEIKTVPLHTYAMDADICGNKIAVAGSDGRIYLYDVEGRLLTTSDIISGRAFRVKFSSACTKLAALHTIPPMISIHDPYTLESFVEEEMEEGGKVIAWDPEARYLFIGSVGKSWVLSYRANERRLKVVWEGYLGDINGAEWLMSGLLLALSDKGLVLAQTGNKVKVWKPQ